MTKNSFIFIAVAVILAAACAALSLPSKSENGGQKTLVNYVDGQLKRIDFLNENYEWSLEYDGKWKVKGSDVTDDSAVENLVGSILNFKGKYVCKAGKSDKEYGVDAHCLKIVYTEKGGAKKEFFLGNKTPPGTEYYLSDGMKIYSIYSETGDAFKTEKYSVESSFVYGIDYENIGKITVSGNPPLEFINRQSKWIVKSGSYKEEVSPEKIRSGVTRHFGGMYSKMTLDGNENNNEKCGFNDDVSTVTIESLKGETDTIYIGSKTDDGIYIKLNDDGKIYKVIKQYFEFIELYREGVY